MGKSYSLTPTVDEAQEFIEIANDFANRLDLVREAISNSFDAGATSIEIDFSVVDQFGESILQIVLTDNGEGMDELGLQAFFDLGNSSRRGEPGKIGEKGHGTKVYINSKKVVVETCRDSVLHTAVMEDPMRKLHEREVPTVEVTSQDTDQPTGTKITILGYNNNRRDRFTHDIIRDHIKWFTRAGSVQWIFDPKQKNRASIRLRGLGRDDYEELDSGHEFGVESKPMKDLFDEHLVAAPDHYCRQIVRTGHLRNHPEIAFQAIFALEGKHVKYGYNKMVRRQGHQAPKGAYKIKDRYGLWLCKDFIPIQHKNDWVPTRGSEWTRLHAFVNCQKFSLTANRGSVENTPSEILDDLRAEVIDIYNQIIESDDWRDFEWLESEAAAYRTVEKEKKDFKWRLKRINNANVASLEQQILVEPKRESGVFAIFLQLSILKPDLFPFKILDYDTHEGIDVIVKSDSTTPIVNAELFYVEFKHTLTRNFNHAFDNLHSVVCWDTDIRHDQTVECLGGVEQRKMTIVAPENDGDHTRYFLENPRKAHRIEVFVLKDYVRQKLDLEFRPRTNESVV